jgi:hypothetical protein
MSLQIEIKFAYYRCRFTVQCFLYSDDGGSGFLLNTDAYVQNTRRYFLEDITPRFQGAAPTDMNVRGSLRAETEFIPKLLLHSLPQKV